MEKLNIILIEDQREVLEAIAKDLEPLEDTFMIEECESAKEAAEVMETILTQGDYVGLLISDHVMPVKSGVEFLIDVSKDHRFPHTKKILLTGLATHQDTIQAINNAAIDRYLEKPWKSDQLIHYVKQLITEFILDTGIPYEPYLDQLDKAILFERLRKTT
ncbi:MAG: response regulator [Cyclobacteriaceae bacterium]|nr:response regulator [Cyclobacteriaceae bacterium]